MLSCARTLITAKPPDASVGCGLPHAIAAAATKCTLANIANAGRPRPAMTNEEECARLPQWSEDASDDTASLASEASDGGVVRRLVRQFERGLVAAVLVSEPDENLAERLRDPVAVQPGAVNSMRAQLAQLFPEQPQRGRDSSVSVNSILSGISEVSFQSESSGIVADHKPTSPYITNNGVALRRAPPPPSTPSPRPRRSSVPEWKTTDFLEQPESLSPEPTPVVSRRSRKPPVIRRMSIVDNNQFIPVDVHWSYGLNQADLELLLKRRKPSQHVEEEEEGRLITNSLEQRNSETERESYSESSSAETSGDDSCADRLDASSVDCSTGTLINEDSDACSASLGASDASTDHKELDNVSIMSVSSYEMVPCLQCSDRVTVSSDEFGSEVCHAPDSDFLTVSAVNEWCVMKTTEPILIQPESNKEKYSRRLKERVNELLHTESVYVDKLRHVVVDYMPEVQREDAPGELRELSLQIFANIDKLFAFHERELLPALRGCEHDLRKLGQCFRKYEQKFLMYVLYSRNNKRSNRLVYEHKKFFQEKQLELGERLDLSSYLLEPVQRLPRYKLFFDDLVKTYQSYESEIQEGESTISKLSNGSQDLAGDDVYGADERSVCSGNDANDVNEDETTLQSLKSAKAMIETLLTTVNDIIALENIRNCPNEINLLKQGKLLRQHEFQVTDGFKRRQAMRVFLFEKLVLLTLVYKKQLTVEIFLYHDHIPVDELGITPMDNDRHRFSVWYRKRSHKHYKLDTPDENVRGVWVNEIMSLLWKQAMHEKELILKRRNARNSVVSVASQQSTTSVTSDQADKYNSLRGVPGEVKRSLEKKLHTSRRTTWYCE